MLRLNEFGKYTILRSGLLSVSRESNILRYSLAPSLKANFSPETKNLNIVQRDDGDFITIPYARRLIVVRLPVLETLCTFFTCFT